MSNRKNALWFLVSTAVGLGFFLWPIHAGGKTTVLFDLATSELLRGCPKVIGVYALLLILAPVAALALLRTRWQAPVRKLFGGVGFFAVLRVLGAGLALCMVFEIGPEFLLSKAVRGVMWDKLILSVSVVIPLGAIVVALLVNYGALDYLGTLMRPIMRPVFWLPGRSALDDLMSWLGPYSVGLYFTRKLFEQGIYSRREAYTVAASFCTVSIGFVGVVATTLDIMHLFPHVFLSYFICVYLLAAIQVRIWPLCRVPDTYLGTPQPEPEFAGPPAFYFRRAWESAIERAASAPPLGSLVGRALADGVLLAATVLGMILAVGTAALLVANETTLFAILGAPLVPVLDFFGLADSDVVAQATVAGVAEVYIPALLARDIALPSRFFVAVMSISQILFLSSVVPMMLELFREVPIRLYELLALFVIRTLILIPILSGLVALLGWLELF